MRTRNLLTVVTAMLLLLLPILAGCKGGATDIGKILDNPSAFQSKDVTIAGHVTRVLDPSQGLLGLAAYQVEDNTGKIWVVTHRGAPSVGSAVGVKATLRSDSNVNLGGEILGAILNEEDRRIR